MGWFSGKSAASYAYDPLNIGGNALKALGIGGKKKGGGGGFEFQPYGGMRPPAIDTDETKILRPTQKQIFDILMARSRGEGVGFDPSRADAQRTLVRNELGVARDDRMRDAKGSLAAAGLSGNPRAYEATSGRIQRDYSRDLENANSRIAIEDLTRANEERDINTARLQNLNSFNFGQENKRADFDLAVYGAEQGNRMGAAQFNEGVNRYNQDSGNQMLGDIGSMALSAYSLSNPATAPMTVFNLANQASSGQGIRPNRNNYDYTSLTPKGTFSQPLNYNNRYLKNLEF